MTMQQPPVPEPMPEQPGEMQQPPTPEPMPEPMPPPPTGNEAAQPTTFHVEIPGWAGETVKSEFSDGDLEYHVRYSRGSPATNDYEEFGYFWTRNPTYYDLSTGEYMPAPGFTTQNGETYGIVQRWADDDATRYGITSTVGTATYSGTGAGYYAKGTAHGHMLTDVSLSVDFNSYSSTGSGTIDNFRTIAGEAIDPDWSMQLELTEINPRSSAYFRYETTPGSPGTGRARGSFRGDLTLSQPSLMVGTFDVDFANGKALGSFGLDKQ